MLPVSYFTPIHKKNGTGGQNQQAKRKRDDVVVDLDDDSVSVEPLHGKQQASDGVQQLPRSSSYAAAHEQTGPYTSSDYQAREASFETRNGQSDRPTPPKQSLSGHGTNESLGELKPPLLGRRQCPPPSIHGRQSSKGSGTRQRHLTILTAILHRSLLQHDYVRAGRIWGMLLRSEVNGHSLDLRSSYRWGLGAEILLRRHRELSQASNQIGSAVKVGMSAAENSGLYINSDDFEKVRQYYDRLSIQYPYYKSFPDAIGPLDFRFAIFSLWIYVSASQDAPNACVHRTIPADARSERPELELPNDFQIEALRRAREISQSLDELMSSPPYSDSESFRNLKAMIDLWTADLAIAALGDDTDTSITDLEVGEQRQYATDVSSIT